VNQNDDFDKAKREATRGVVEYLKTGEAPQLSICVDRPVTDDRFGRAVEAVTEAMLDWEILDWAEVADIVEAKLAREGL
jgi:hypothetical protein